MNQKLFFEQRKLELEKEIVQTKSRLSKLPPGLLKSAPHRKGNKTYYQWLRVDEINGVRVQTYLRKEDSQLIKRLAQKTYLTRLLVDKEKELKCINYFIKHRGDSRHLELLSPASPYSALLVNSSLLEWENEDYPKSTDHPEHLIIPAPKGEFVRSKSEAMIAQALFDNNIPYRYENIHRIAGQDFATDFTILHPVKRKIILWEHLGKADDPKYQPTIPFKIDKYLQAGYLPGKDLILTFEDSKTPLNYPEIQYIINKFFT